MTATFAALEENNILVTTCELQDVVLPPRMRIMRGVLLDFQGTIFDLYDLKDNEDPWKLLRHSAWYKETTERQSSIMKLIQRAEVTKGHAEEKLLKRGDETEWREFFSGKFFSPLHEAFDSTKENSRKQVCLSRQKYFYDSFNYSADKNWNLFNKRTGYRVNDRRGLWKPKPDTVCYFPVHDIKKRVDTVSTGGYSWRDTAHESLVQNFTLETLDQLKRFGLQYCPLDSSKGKPKPDSAQSLHCFPWLIAEYKVAEKQKEKCLCQAANAGTAALMLLQTAARFATDKLDNRHVPPVVTITTTSNYIKVWMMYCTTKDSEDTYIMDPIWEGDMTKVSDCIKFEYILENVHTWATRSLKPLLSSYIDQWRHRFLEQRYECYSMGDLYKKMTALEGGKVSDLLDLNDVFDTVADMYFEQGRADAASAFEESRGLDGDDLFEELKTLIDSRLEKFTVTPVAARRTSKAGPDSPPPTDGDRPQSPSSEKTKDSKAPFEFGIGSTKNLDKIFETTFAERFADVQFFVDGADTWEAGSSTKRFKGPTKSSNQSNLKTGGFSWSRAGSSTRAASTEPLSKQEPLRSD